MTAVNLDFMRTPSFQRAMRKLDRLSPEQLNIYNSLLQANANKAAHQTMMKEIGLRKMAFQMGTGARGVESARERVKVRREGTASTETTRMADIASREKTGISGTETGKAISMEGMESTARRKADVGASKRAISERGLEEKKAALPYEVGVGVAKVGLGYLTGEAERAKEQRRIDFYNQWAKEIGMGGEEHPWIGTPSSGDYWG